MAVEEIQVSLIHSKNNKISNVNYLQGGPLQITKYFYKKYYEIVGITSFGKFCAAGVPAVYVRVASYLDWIENVVWKV